MKSIFIIYGLFFSFQSLAQMDQFHAGKVIENHGKIAEVEGMDPLPPGTQFNVSFDVSKAAVPGEINRSINSVARFINMHDCSWRFGKGHDCK